jgi:SAM-dependent methyltransferase
MNLQEQLLAWLRSPRIPSTSYEETVESLHQASERVRFLKQLPSESTVLDAGAGDGSLEVFRSWLRPIRKDLKMYAYAAQQGERFRSYDAYEIGYWPHQPPNFDGQKFDAIMACHFIEHLDDPIGFVGWAASRLSHRGRIYLEWPSETTLSLPPREYFSSAGVPLIISRFDDDKTHKTLPNRSVVCNKLAKAGLNIEVNGIIRHPWLEDELLAHWQSGKANIYALQAAFWSRTKWCQFVVAAI